MIYKLIVRGISWMLDEEYDTIPGTTMEHNCEYLSDNLDTLNKKSIDKFYELDEAPQAYSNTFYEKVGDLWIELEQIDIFLDGSGEKVRQYRKKG